MNAAAQAAAARQQHRLFADSGRFNARCLNSGRAAESPESLTSGSSKPRCDAAAQAAAARQEHRLLTDQGMLLARFLPFWRTADLFSFFFCVFWGTGVCEKNAHLERKMFRRPPFTPRQCWRFAQVVPTEKPAQDMLTSLCLGSANGCKINAHQQTSQH